MHAPSLSFRSYVIMRSWLYLTTETNSCSFITDRTYLQPRVDMSVHRSLHCWKHYKSRSQHFLKLHWLWWTGYSWTEHYLWCWHRCQRPQWEMESQLQSTREFHLHQSWWHKWWGWSHGTEGCQVPPQTGEWLHVDTNTTVTSSMYSDSVRLEGAPHSTLAIPSHSQSPVVLHIFLSPTPLLPSTLSLLAILTLGGDVELHCMMIWIPAFNCHKK